MKKQFYFMPEKQQRGVTLVELMVSITIGLILVLFISSLYLSSRQSYRINDDSSRLQEEGRAALYLLGNNLVQAGSGVLTMSTTGVLPKTNFETLMQTEPALYPFRACSTGFTNPAGQDFSCAVVGTPAFEVSYMVDAAYNANTGAGADCNGQSVSFKANPATQFLIGDTNRYATNRFYLNNGTLFCAGNGSATPQPILDGVVAMQVSYGVNQLTVLGTPDDTRGFRSADTVMTTEAEVAGMPVGANIQEKWRNVVRVEICLELQSQNQVRTGPQTYVNCNGQVVNIPYILGDATNDKRLHTVVTGVYTLRNNASPANF